MLETGGNLTCISIHAVHVSGSRENSNFKKIVSSQLLFCVRLVRRLVHWMRSTGNW